MAITKFAVLLLIFVTAGLPVGTSAVPAFTARPGPVQASGQSEVWRTRPPRPGPARPFKLPEASEVAFKNGLRLLLVEDHRVPLVTIAAGIPVGKVDDPPDSRGIAEATADLLTEGSGGRSSEELARQVETLGARLFSAAFYDYTEIGGSAVAENAGRLLELIGDVILRPDFHNEEIELYKENRVQNLVVQRQDPAFLVSERFRQVLYGAHPYAVVAPSPEVISTLDRKQIHAFYRKNYAPAGAVIVVVGDFDPASIERGAKTIFGDWKPDARPERKYPAVPEIATRKLVLIDRPGSDQADFRIGNLAVSRSDPDYFPLLVASTILGGGASSRLFLNIREEKGYTYDVFTTVSAPRLRGAFYGGSETRTEVTLPALREMLSEFDRMRRQPVSARDLQNAKNYLNGVFSLILSTQGGIADQLLQAYMLGLGRDHLRTYRARVDAVTVRQVLRAARTYILSRQRTAIVVVGDAKELRKPLSTLGPVEVFNATGKPLR